VQCLGDADGSFSGGRDLGEPLVDLHAAAQRDHRLLERRVGPGQLLGNDTLARVQARVGYGHAGLLRHHLSQELLLAGGRVRRAGDHVADRAGDAAQRVGPGPFAAPGSKLAAGLGERAQLLVQLRDDGAVAVPVGPPRLADREPGDPPPAERRGGGHRQPEDLLVVGALGHQDG